MESTVKLIENALSLKDYETIIKDLFTAARCKLEGEEIGFNSVTEPDKKTIKELIGMAIAKARYCSGLQRVDFQRLCRWASTIGDAGLYEEVKKEAIGYFPKIKIAKFEQ